jgi:hypothetical protein
MSLPRLFCMVPGVNGMTSRGVSVVSGFLVMPTFMMFCRFIVVPSGMGMVLRSLPMMLCGFLRHGRILLNSKD